MCQRETLADCKSLRQHRFAVSTGTRIGRRRNRSATHSRRSSCAVACTLDLVGDRWSLLLIRDLLGGRRRFGELLAAPESIPTNILAERLGRLEEHSLIRRVPYNAHPPRFEYELTAKGRALGRAVAAIAEWGLRHIAGTKRTLWPKLDPSET